METTDRLNRNISDTDYVGTDPEQLLESGLWRAVIAQAISDTALGDERQQLDIARWLRTRDFVTVCDFADIDSALIKGQMENLLTMSSRVLRKHYSKQLCSSINKRVKRKDRLAIYP